MVTVAPGTGPFGPTTVPCIEPVCTETAVSTATMGVEVPGLTITDDWFCRNPGAFTVTTYTPGVRLRKVKAPLPSLVPVLIPLPQAAHSAVTLALGTAFP